MQSIQGEGAAAKAALWIGLDPRHLAVLWDRMTGCLPAHLMWLTARSLVGRC